MSLRLEVDHTGADLKFDRLMEATPEMLEEWIRQGSEIVEGDLVANAPVRTGFLRSSIRTEVSQYRAEISTNSGYGKAVNDGWPARVITARNAKALRFVVNGKVIFRKSVFHPGFGGHHFKEKTVEMARPKLYQLAESLLRQLKAKVMG